MTTEKPHRIRVKALDGKPRERNKLKGQLVPHVDVVDAKDSVEFVICAVKPGHLDQVRAKLASAGLEEVSGGDTAVSMPDPRPARARQSSPRGGPSRPPTPPSTEPDLRKKPYGFVHLPDVLATAPPVWHDGTGAGGRLSGEVRLELETLTPLLVGWERRRIDDTEEPWPISHTAAVGGDIDAFLQRAAHQAHRDADDQRKQRAVEQARQEYVNRVRAQVVDVAIDGVGRTIVSKSVLCPLRAPWGERPVLLPGDSIKGLLRHELGAFLGAPMERVAERSYSYRPNMKYPDHQTGRFLEPRLARVSTATTVEAGGETWSFPERVDVLHMATRGDQSYYPRRERDPATNRSSVIGPPLGSEPYKGGLGGGRKLPDAVLSADARRRIIHTHIDVGTLGVEHARVLVSDVITKQYARTLNHLLDSDDGHFSARHPNVGTDQETQRAATGAIRNAARGAFQPGDLIWVEWDTQKEGIVSLGWHYYYRWAYADTVRRKGGTLERHGLFPLPDERVVDEEGAPQGLSAVRRLFGYTGDNEGSKGIGKGDHGDHGDHEQLMGRLSVNAAIEVIGDGDTAQTRFLPPTFLRELGMPRPSAVEHYLEQPHHPNPRPSDKASLTTYGDAAEYDEPGKLAGRKFYLDREDAYTDEEPWKDESDANRLNDRSTLALEASCLGRRFRFTVRFRDLDTAELAAVLAVLCPHQFRAVLGGNHTDGYCSKLGYARPLGWGTVRIEAKTLLLLDTSGDLPALDPVADLPEWLREHHEPTPTAGTWLAVHRHKHPDAADYPQKDGQIYTFHTTLRAEHTRRRRYDKEGRP